MTILPVATGLVAAARRRRWLLAASVALPFSAPMISPAWAQGLAGGDASRTMPTLQAAPGQQAVPDTGSLPAGPQYPTGQTVTAPYGPTGQAVTAPYGPTGQAVTAPYGAVLTPTNQPPQAAQAQPAMGQPTTTQPVAAADSRTTRDAINVLIQQATFWRDQFQPDRAMDALNRALQLDPTNPDAYAVMAQIQADAGDRNGALASLQKLRAGRPSDPRIGKIEQAIRTGPINQQELDAARALATQGRNADAVAAYERIFRGNPPPDRIALEYYQTLAGLPAGWDRARIGIGQMVIAAPTDLKLQLAYAQVLTYREQTRAEGIQRLTQLAANPAVGSPAYTALHQTMLWLPTNNDSIPLFEAYLRDHPNDADVGQRLAQARNPQIDPADAVGQMRQAGFNALNANKLDDAGRIFEQVLAGNPEDADALGGLGVVRLRQGRRPEARDLLSHAMAADPTSQDRWQQALNGATNTGAPRVNAVSGQYAQVRVLADRGDYAGAETLLNKITGGRGNTGMSLALADIQSRAGRLAEAEASYNAVLKAQPKNVTALIGLAGVLTREGRGQEADDLFARAEATGNKKLVGQARAEELRQRAQEVGDPVAQAGLYRAANAADPSNPWIRLELARALVRAGQPTEARSLMLGAADARGASSDSLKAALIFAQETNDSSAANDIIGRIPARSRTADMRTLLDQAKAQTDIADAVASYRGNRGQGRQRLLSIAAVRDPSGMRGTMVAKAFLQLGDQSAAREAISTAMGVNPNPSVDARLGYAGALLSLGQMNEADNLLNTVDAQHNLSADQSRAADSLHAGIAVRAADVLARQGRQADAYDQLAPVLERHPDNADANMALARLYESADKPRPALSINMALLRRDPNNLDVRRSAVDAAIAVGDYSTAERLANEATQGQPNEPKAWLISAEVQKARGNTGRALRDLRTARDLRRNQLGVSQAVGSGPHVELTQSTGYANGPLPLTGDQYRGGGATPVATDSDTFPRAPLPAVDAAAPAQPAYAQPAYTTAPVAPNAYPFANGPAAAQPYQPAAQPSQVVQSAVATPEPANLAPYAPLQPQVNSLPDTSPAVTAPYIANAPRRGVVAQVQQNGSDTMPRSTTPGSGTYDLPPVNPDNNPFRRARDNNAGDGNSGLSETLPGTAQRSVVADPMVQDIDQQIASLQDVASTKMEAGFSLRTRSGTGGLDKLTELMVPVEATFSPGGGPGIFRLQATPTYLNAGAVGNSPLNRAGFGSLALYSLSDNTPPPGGTSATGLGLDADFLWRWVNVDVGTTPVGFRTENVLGGIELSPRIGPDTVLRMTGERRAVTDSVLSYAGQVDPRTGLTWGGVTRTRGHAQLETGFGPLSTYIGGGYSMLAGQNVASNTEIEFGAGGSYPVYKEGDDQVRVGLDLVYFGYDKNLRYFSLGQGGYFSPQSYMAALVPVTWTGRDDDWSWTVGATVGLQNFHEASSPVLPTNAADQQQLVYDSQGNPSVVAVNPGRTSSGFSGGLNGAVDYRISTNLHLGAKGDVQQSGDWTEAQGLFYAKYTFNGVQ